ncbi:PRD domain-containing protein [Bacillus pumilus]|nr:PRD domain-containing protein [Bacillus pumilus]
MIFNLIRSDRRISLHLRSAIHRFKYDMNIRNPYLPDIKRHIPLHLKRVLYGEMG